MQPEDCKNEYSCRLCFNFINNINSETIEKATKRAVEFVFPNMNLEEGHSHRMCKACLTKLVAAFNFKSSCVSTEDILNSHIKASKVSVINLKEICLRLNGNIRLADISENHTICRLCLQLLTYGFMSVDEVNNGIMDTYIPDVDLGVTKDPVICRPCFDLLLIYGSFVRNCLEAQEKCRSADSQLYNKTEEIHTKLEDCYDAQDTFRNIDNSYIKCEETERGDQDKDPSSYSLDEEAIENKKKHISEDIGGIKDEYKLECETEVEIKKCKTLLSTLSYKNRYKPIFENKLDYKIIKKRKHSSKIEIYKCDNTFITYENICKKYLERHRLVHRDPSEIRTYKCDICHYETKRKGTLKTHQLLHQEPSEVQMYKCDACTFETKYKANLKFHQLTHEDSFKIPMYKCDTCDYENKRKDALRHHQLIHKDPSEIEMYKCNHCTFETKHKYYLKTHKLIHKDPSETPMYWCDVCNYGSNNKRNLKTHQLTHKHPSEIQMYGCDACDYKTKHKSSLKYHLLTHKNRFEINQSVFKCDACDYETIRKDVLNRHKLIHKDPSETQMYWCDICKYGSNRKGNLKSHLLTHKHPTEIQMYGCDVCDYETKRKSDLKYHELIHKDPSEIQMYRCDACEFQTKWKRGLICHLLTHKHRSEMNNECTNEFFVLVNEKSSVNT